MKEKYELMIMLGCFAPFFILFGLGTLFNLEKAIINIVMSGLLIYGTIYIVVGLILLFGKKRGIKHE